MVKIPSAEQEAWMGSIPGLGKFPGVGNGKPIPVFLPGKFHGQKSLVGYSSWGHKESDRMSDFTFTFIIYLRS